MNENTFSSEYGIVSRVTRSGYVHVRLSRKTACDNCKMCLIPRNEMFVELKAKNTNNFKFGDFVSVRMPKRSVLNSALIFYLFPLIIVGIVLFLTYKQALWVTFSSVFGSLFLSYVLVAIFEKHVLRKSKNFSPVIMIAEDITETEVSNLTKLIKDKTITVEDEYGEYELTSKERKDEDIDLNR